MIFFSASLFLLAASACSRVVEKSKILDGKNIQPGDVVLGLTSSGVHSNGFSLIRKLLERSAASMPQTLDGMPYKEALMAPTRLYVKPVLEALKKHPIKGLAHITGGGLIENIPRILPSEMGVQLVRKNWPQTELFDWAQKTAGIDDFEMNRSFNNGLGMVVIIAAQQAQACIATLKSLGESVHAIGEVIALKSPTPDANEDSAVRVFIS